MNPSGYVPDYSYQNIYNLPPPSALPSVEVSPERMSPKPTRGVDRQRSFAQDEKKAHIPSAGKQKRRTSSLGELNILLPILSQSGDASSGYMNMLGSTLW